jgi:hypothetical protein
MLSIGDLIQVNDLEMGWTYLLVDGGEYATLRFKMLPVTNKEVGIILSLEPHEFLKGEENYFLVCFGDNVGYLPDDRFIVLQQH